MNDAHTKRQNRVNVRLCVLVPTKRPYLVPSVLATSRTWTVLRECVPSGSGTHSSRRSKTQLLCFLHSNSPSNSGNDTQMNGQTSQLSYLTII